MNQENLSYCRLGKAVSSALAKRQFYLLLAKTKLSRNFWIRICNSRQLLFPLPQTTFALPGHILSFIWLIWDLIFPVWDFLFCHLSISSLPNRNRMKAISLILYFLIATEKKRKKTGEINFNNIFSSKPINQKYYHCNMLCKTC